MSRAFHRPCLLLRQHEGRPRSIADTGGTLITSLERDGRTEKRSSASVQRSPLIIFIGHLFAGLLFAGLLVTGCGAPLEQHGGDHIHEVVPAQEDHKADPKDVGGGEVPSYDDSEPENEPMPEKSEATSPAPVSLELSADDGPGWAHRRAERRVGEAQRAIQLRLEAFGGSTHGAQRVAVGCGETCQLAEAICESRDTICEIAAQYGASYSFESECTWAEEECSGAQGLCHKCRGDL